MCKICHWKIFTILYYFLNWHFQVCSLWCTRSCDPNFTIYGHKICPLSCFPFPVSNWAIKILNEECDINFYVRGDWKPCSTNNVSRTEQFRQKFNSEKGSFFLLHVYLNHWKFKGFFNGGICTTKKDPHSLTKGTSHKRYTSYQIKTMTWTISQHWSQK